ncbi:hypothetical protein CPAV1605_270 [seawater metagenome]|uniref:Uncharacterized protein n=1 Tax=seawater metagenome TaxID=1561972 RepID=A0A5E8CL17_9ZZZZ
MTYNIKELQAKLDDMENIRNHNLRHKLKTKVELQVIKEDEIIFNKNSTSYIFVIFILLIIIFFYFINFFFLRITQHSIWVVPGNWSKIADLYK